MSGFWRNLVTFFAALFKCDAAILQNGCSCSFWVTPFDVGIQTLKSYKYLQLAESAQLDFGVRSGLLGRMRRVRCAMVNVEQQIQFGQPIKLFDRVCVKSSIAFADAKFVHFQHLYFVPGQQCASVSVKAKFKAGRVTQSAVDLTGLSLATKPHPASGSASFTDHAALPMHVTGSAPAKERFPACDVEASIGTPSPR